MSSHSYCSSAKPRPGLLHKRQLVPSPSEAGPSFSVFQGRCGSKSTSAHHVSLGGAVTVLLGGPVARGFVLWPGGGDAGSRGQVRVAFLCHSQQPWSTWIQPPTGVRVQKCNWSSLNCPPRSACSASHRFSSPLCISHGWNDSCSDSKAQYIEYCICSCLYWTA